MRLVFGPDTTCHAPLLSRCIWATVTPCAAWLLRTLSAFQVFMPSGCRRPSSVYSWLTTQRPFVDEPCSGKNAQPSWCMPNCLACCSGVLITSYEITGNLPLIGSPHAATTAHRYPLGTTMPSVAMLRGTESKVNGFAPPQIDLVLCAMPRPGLITAKNAALDFRKKRRSVLVSRVFWGSKRVLTMGLSNSFMVYQLISD